MRFDPSMQPNGGVCKACGKPTRLLVHQGCGEKMSSSRSKGTSVKQNRLNYKKGRVPPFAREGK